MPMLRRFANPWVLLSAVLALLPSLTLPAADWNVVLIVADDLGAHDLGVTGSAFHETPNLDRLAREGLRFTQAYSACTVCSPSRAALLTGRYPARLKLTDWIAGHDAPKAKLRPPAWTQQLPLDELTLAERLPGPRATLHLGKWHLGGAGFEPERQGFDINLGGGSRGQPPSYFAPYGITNLPSADVPGEYLTDREADEAVRFLRTHPNQPFLLNYWPHAVHTPLQAPTNLIAKYRAKAATLGLPPGHSQTNAVYAAMLERLDTAVGAILDTLRDTGLAERTVVIFTSDNGGLVLGNPPPTSNAPLRSGKGSPYEGGHRVPLFIRWPGLTRPGTTCAEPVMGIDLAPTLVQLTSAHPETPLPTGFDGVSLAPLLHDPSATLNRPLFWHYPHYHPGGATPYAALRDGPWKLIQFYETGRHELYHLGNDPSEAHDLAAEQPDKVLELSRKLFAWQGTVGAQWPMSNPAWTPAIVPAQPDGRILLHARDAALHAEVLRYEPQPFKNTLGWWSRPQDWAEWVFDCPRATRYELLLTHGCGNGSGGSDVVFAAAGQSLPFQVVETGGFQNWTNRILGRLDLPAGRVTLSVKPIHKPGAAVMDLRQITLTPVPAGP